MIFNALQDLILNSFLALFPMLPPLYWPPHYSWTMPSILPPQDLCICCFLFQKCYFPKYLHGFSPYFLQVFCTNIDFSMILFLNLQLLYTFLISLSLITPNILIYNFILFIAYFSITRMQFPWGYFCFIYHCTSSSIVQ